MLRVLIVGAALGLSNFAASIAIGVSGVDGAVRWRVAAVFGIFEAAMPLCGLLIGRGVASSLGSTSNYVGGGLLIATGLYALAQAQRADGDHRAPGTRLGPLVVAGAALSVDNLVVGFALGTKSIPVGAAVAVIAAVSVAMSLAGLELGARLGRRVERWSEEIGAAVLIAVGVAVTTGAL